jgi:hypothetical protein
VAPIHALMVPNGCSTVWRRTRILSGRFARRAAYPPFKHAHFVEARACE